MESSITSSPELFKEELKRGITQNHQKLEHARLQPDNEDNIRLYTDRMNNGLQNYFASFVEVDHE